MRLNSARAWASRVGLSPRCRTHDARGRRLPQFQRTRQAQQVIPVLGSQGDMDAGLGDGIELAVIGCGVDPPEPGTADIGEPGAETIAEQPEQAKHPIAAGAGIGHDLGGLQFGLLFQDYGQENQTVAEGTGDGDGMEASERVRNQVVPGDAAAGTEILGIRAGVNRTHRDHEAQAIRRWRLRRRPRTGPGRSGFAPPPAWRWRRARCPRARN